MGKVLRRTANGVRIFNGRNLVLIAAGMIAAMIAITMIYEYTLLRYLIMVVAMPVIMRSLYQYLMNRKNA